MDRARDAIITYGILLAAACVAVADVHRSFFDKPVSMPYPGGPPRRIEPWADVIRNGVLIGDSEARVKVAVFSDLECPICRRFHSELANARRLNPEVAVVFVHYPLGQHRWARTAAHGAECAAAAGYFEPFVNSVYAKQDSLGSKTWVSYALEAGLADTAAFSGCMSDSTRNRRIDAGIALGKRLGILGTPTVVINAMEYSTPPFDSLQSIIERLSAPRRGGR